MSKDIEEIRKLEKDLGIELKRVKEITPYNYGEKKCEYVLNEKGELVSLTLNYIQLKKIPELSFEKLTSLSLSGNQISKIENLDGLISLHLLDLGDNQITKIEGLDWLATLEKLNLWKNQITKIEGLDWLATLQDLNLINNQIHKIENLDWLTTLQDLNLSNNQIHKIENLDKLTTLQGLNLRGNQISKIENLDKLTVLQKMGLANNQFSKIENLDKLTALQELYLWSNQISTIENLDKLTTLQLLNLDSNQITKIENLDKLTTLQLLNLDSNQITKIENLDSLSALQLLNLDSNQITKIENLEMLTALQSLILSNNQIAKIENLDKLTALQSLNLRSNQITKIEDLDTLTSLKWLGLEENPIAEEAGTTLEAVKNYLSKKRVKGQLIKLPVKVMFLGNHQSGKTTYLHYFKDRKVIENTKSTHVLDIQLVYTSEKDKNIPQAIVYDFGGQDYYHGLYQAFFTQNAVNVLFWCNQTNSNTPAMDTDGYPIRNFNLNYWVAQLNYYHRKATEPQALFLVQTHANKEFDKRDTQVNPSLQLEVKNEFYLSLVHDTNSVFCEAGLEHLRHCISQEIAQRSKEKEYLPYFIHFMDYIVNYRKAESIAVWKIFEDKKIYGREPLEGETEQILFGFFIQDLILLSERGLILYYPEQETKNTKTMSLYKKGNTLEDYVWLNPAVTIENIHKNIFKKENLRNINNRDAGRLSPQKFKNLCPDIQTREMLLHEKIVFFNHNEAKPEESTYILPGYLDYASNDPAFDMMKFGFQKPDFSLKFENFIPFGLINQLICWFGKNPDKKHFWRDQLIFTLYNQYKVWIRLDTTQFLIQVFVAENTNSGQHNLKLKDILKLILFNILDLYWGKEPNYKTKEKETKAYQNFQSPETTNNEFGVWMDEYYNDISHYLKTKKIQAPNDMYLSVDGKNYINYKELVGYNGNSQNFAAKTIDPKDGQKLKDSSINTVNIHLVKHLVNNENLNRMKKIFISYSRKDIKFKNKLKEHLGILRIFDIADAWTCDQLSLEKWHEKIQKELEESDLIIYMLSANFFNSQYIIDNEVHKGMQQVSKDQNKKVLCVIVRDFVDLHKLKSTVKDNHNETINAILELSNWQFLPYAIKNEDTNDEDQKITPLKRHPNPEQAYTQIVEKIIDVFN